MAERTRSRIPWLAAGATRQDAGIWLAGVGFALLLGLLAWKSRSWSAPLAAAAVGALAWYYIAALGLRAGLVVLLIVTTFADRFTFAAGPVALRSEQVAALIAAAAAVYLGVRDGLGSWWRPSLAEVLLIAWLALSLGASLLESPDRRLSAKIVVLFAVSSLGLFLPRRLLSDGAQMETAVRWLLIAFASEGAYGTAAYLLHVFGSSLAVAPNAATDHLNATGTLWEQNVFGAVCAAGAVAWAYLGRERFSAAWLGLAACLGGLVTSLTRAAWLAAAVVALIGAALPRLRQRLDGRTLLWGGAGGLVLAAATVLVDRVGDYHAHVAAAAFVPPPPPGQAPAATNLLTAILSKGDLKGRFDQALVVWDDLKGHLALGRGTQSYEAMHVYKGQVQHIASLPMAVVHDTGVIGLLLFAAFLAAIFWAAWSRRRDPLVAVFGQVALIVLLTNLSTETMELMVGWFLIGLLLAAVRLAAPPTGPSRE